MLLSRLQKTIGRSDSQILPMAALVIIVLFASVGLAVDVGRCFVAKAELVRAVDAAALAGTLELSGNPAQMQTQVNAQVAAYMAQNQPDAAYNTTISQADKQVQISATLAVKTIFLQVLGIGTVNVAANATAGYGVLAVDTVLVIDATGSMGVDSNGQNCVGHSGCPIDEAKNAAKSFTDTLLTGTASSDTLVGETPFRGCFNLPNLFSFCVPLSTMSQSLSNSKTTIENTISSISSVGGSGTNICNGINQADQILYGANHHTVSNTMRIVVLLSDGDNVYNNVANGVPTPTGNHTPTPIAGYQLPSACRPPTPNVSDQYVDTQCRSAQTKERALDTDTINLVNTLKAQGVEFYVIGFGVCGSNDGTISSSSYCANIGNGDTDNTADRRLLKCIASSTSGSNDHYFETTDASQLPNIFQQIARLIGFRLIK